MKVHRQRRWVRHCKEFAGLLVLLMAAGLLIAQSAMPEMIEAVGTPDSAAVASDAAPHDVARTAIDAP